jgi:hypothetical protein
MCLDAVRMDALEVKTVSVSRRKYLIKSPVSLILCLLPLSNLLFEILGLSSLVSLRGPKAKRAKERRLKEEKKKTKTSINRPKRAFFSASSVTLRQLKNCLRPREKKGKFI